MPLSKAALERLIEASPDIVVATDHDGTVAYYNDGAQEILGYARDEIIGQLVVRLYPSIDEARRVMAAMRSEENGVGRVVNFPTRFVHKDTHEIPVAISGVILRDDSDEEQGTIGFAKDLTEIIRKDQMALLGEVAVGLSHEINNPLSVITNQLTLLERFVDKIAEPHEPEQGRNRIKTIKHEVKRARA
jgi:PAS domain S-box-containing protein